MILTRAEVVELTGRKTRAGQIAVLAQNGVRFIIAADGWPRVLEAALVSWLPEPVPVPAERPWVWMAREWRRWIVPRASILSAPPASAPFAPCQHVYALIDGDEITYVGRSHQPEMRFEHNRRYSGRRFTRTWTISGFPDDAADFVEAMYILGLRPPENSLEPRWPDGVPKHVDLAALFEVGS